MGNFPEAMGVMSRIQLKCYEVELNDIRNSFSAFQNGSHHFMALHCLIVEHKAKIFHENKR